MSTMSPVRERKKRKIQYFIQINNFFFFVIYFFYSIIGRPRDFYERKVIEASFAFKLCNFLVDWSAGELSRCNP